ncbi:MAG: hypothetical protein DCC58_06335 [Chloroflexi bacterium]|nr:MAG: hypothetical protein DCC58_06335 [Chloroflexota bacterium]
MVDARHREPVGDGDAPFRQAGVVGDRAVARHPLGDESAVGQGRQVAQGGEGSVSGAVGVVGISSDVHLRRVMLLEQGVAKLQPAGHQFNNQQAIGDEEQVVRVAGGVVQLHAALVEVLHEARAAGSLGIWLDDRWGVRARPPDPGAGDRAARHRRIGPPPGALERGSIRRDNARRVARRGHGHAGQRQQGDPCDNQR